MSWLHTFKSLLHSRAYSFHCLRCITAARHGCLHPSPSEPWSAFTEGCMCKVLAGLQRGLLQPKSCCGLALRLNDIDPLQTS